MRERRQFSSEFKLEAVRLVESGVPQSQVCRDLDIVHSVLERWIAKFGQRADGSRVTPEEHAELRQLRKENALLKLERDILKKAIGICTKELP
jgi:transposase-like protein